MTVIGGHAPGEDWGPVSLGTEGKVCVCVCVCVCECEVEGAFML